MSLATTSVSGPVPGPLPEAHPTALPGADARVERSRLGVIDSFRGIAILSVMAFHFTVALTPPLISPDHYHYAHPFPMWLEAGRYGVHVFFIISGLVIAQTLMKTRNALEFFWKRFARLYPAYLFAVTLAFVLVAVIGPPITPASLGDYLANLTMDARDLGRPWIDPVYWTLLVELKFYLIAGLAYALLGRQFWVGLVGYALATAVLAHFATWGAHIWLISDDMPFFLAGVAARFYCFDRRKGPAAACLVAALSLYAYYNLGFPRTCAFQGICLHVAPDYIAQTYVGLVGGGLLILLALGVRRGLAPLSFIGRISYSVYLIHSLLGLLIIRALKAAGAPDLAAMLAASALTLAAGWVMFNLVEEPGHRWLLALHKRWRGGRKLATAAAAG
jgi:peptidoglycan/LPS O-acetylase OafA/YrhL